MLISNDQQADVFDDAALTAFEGTGGSSGSLYLSDLAPTPSKNEAYDTITPKASSKAKAEKVVESESDSEDALTPFDKTMAEAIGSTPKKPKCKAKPAINFNSPSSAGGREAVGISDSQFSDKSVVGLLAEVARALEVCKTVKTVDAIEEETLHSLCQRLEGETESW